MNTLYYGRDDGGSVTFDVNEMSNLLSQFSANISNWGVRAYAEAMWTNLQCTVVDETGTIVSPYPVDHQVLIMGDNANANEGSYLTAIIAFFCEEFNPGQATRVPKRTHIKYGPITVGSTLAKQLLTPTAMIDFQALADVLTMTIVTGGGVTLIPTRVGTTTDSQPVGAEGRIVGTVVRPTASILRSRMWKTTNV
jgi:hypothetical protein